MEKIIENNSDFLFIYDAAMCNPNGDPDQENKPRMDYNTDTNLVTDIRLKRYIRDYLITWGKNNDNKEKNEIFVSFEGDSHVTSKDKLRLALKRTIKKIESLREVFYSNSHYFEIYKKIYDEKKGDIDKIFNIIADKKFEHKGANYSLLDYYVKNKFLDVRLFGCAFAIDGFTKPYTGPIQVNWGYSLNKVYPVDSNSIVTIMAEESSTFGKDYRIYYSLLAFSGTINKNTAQSTGLTEIDQILFRKAIIEAIPALPTRSKINQFPKLYLELMYNDGFQNGHFGDLRKYITATPILGKTDKQVREFKDLVLDVSRLNELISNNKGNQKPIKEIYIWKSDDFPIVRN